MTSRTDLHHPELARLLRLQCGVLSRRQLVAAGATNGDIERLLRRKELRRVHPGIFVDHTGPLTYEQREWLAVLAAWPAALAGESAVPGRRPAMIEVVVGRGRTVRVPPGVRLRRRDAWAEQVRRGTKPPRLALEHAAIDVLSRHLARDDVAEAFAELARLCFRRPGLPAALLTALAGRSRVTGRATIKDLVDDLRAGACSVLERGYLHRVERAHGLPTGSRQDASDATGHRTLRDVHYEQFGLIVELQGKAFHDSPEAYDADAQRDLAERAAGGRESLRVTYGLVFRTPCRTAALIAQVLHRRGWTVALRACPRCPRPWREPPEPVREPPMLVART